MIYKTRYGVTCLKSKHWGGSNCIIKSLWPASLCDELEASLRYMRSYSGVRRTKGGQRSIHRELKMGILSAFHSVSNDMPIAYIRT